MKKGDELKRAQEVRINAGKWRGLVGVVVALSEDGGRANVKVSGIFNNKPVDFEQWFPLASLGRPE